MSEQMPQLPQEISSNGQEIWDWAAKLSDYTQKRQRSRELWQKIAATSLECGNCDYWMKSSLCPREVNVNGRNRGPSCKALVCSKFKMDFSAAQRLEEMKAEYAELNKQDGKS